MTSIILIGVPVNAQQIIPPLIDVPSGVTPKISLDTIAYLSIRPNPVGVGQAVLVNIWLEPPTHYSRYLTGLEVVITKPNGETETIGPITTYQGDGTAWFEYTVDQIGTWKFKFNFPGNYYAAGIVPPGFMQPNPQFIDSAYYKPSSTKEVELVVQEEPRIPWIETPYPTDYWTRPVSPENREWASQLGDFPYMGYMKNPPTGTNHHASNYKFTPYVQGPETAHVVWKRLGALSGLMGVDMEKRLFGAGEGTYAGTPAIVFEGRCYQAVTKPFNGVTQTVLECYDLRTGKMFWEKIDVPAPTAITYIGGAEAVPGATQSQVGTGANLVAISGGRLIRIHPFTGAVVLNISISPLTTGTIYRDPFVLTVQDLGASAANATGGRYRLVNWTIAGTGTNFTTRIMSNISWPFTSIGTCDYDSMVAVTTQGITPAGAGIAMDAYIIGTSLTSGNILWNVTAGAGFGIYSGSTACADHGKFVIRFNDGYWHCWNLNSGQKLWKSELSSWPWGIWGGYSVASAYGLLYYMQYDGIVAYDWDTGKIVWHYSSGDSGYETPYNTWPFFVRGIQIADEKIYIGNGEHSPTSPLPRGWRLHCMNALTGEGIFNITGGGDAGAIADGYLTYDNRYDGYMYVYGKGQSQTTIQAPLTAITSGQSLMIIGTVMDMSPGQPNTPCVSKESMTQWMEYLHMQKPIPTDVKGVPVSIDAVDPNGNSVHIADVTTDMSGSFKTLWTPEIAGEYVVTATFVGDDSYGSSWAETAVGVVEALIAPTATPINLDAVNNNMMMGFIGVGIGIIIAIILAVLLLRKRP